MGTTEIRVHGVGDRGPEDILGHPVVVRVAGDQDAGFYRPRPGFGDPAAPSGARLEAYRWSRLTGGTGRRTFSLVLLMPFMLANIAVWMLPVAGRAGAPARAVCRLLGATLTGLYVLSMVGASVDLIGWQCAASRTCLEGRRSISWLVGVPVGQRMAILAVVPVLAVVVLWHLGARTWQLPEDAYGTPHGVGANRLDAPDFWDTRTLLRRLRSIHVAVALGTLDVALLLPLTGHDRSAPGLALLAAVAVLLAAALVLLCRPAVEARGEGPRTGRRTRSLRWAAIAPTVLTLGYAATPRERLDWRWISLWRQTDPIGGRVFPPDLPPDDPAAAVDRRVRDPKGLLIPPGDTVPPPVCGHRFEADEEFHRAVGELSRRLADTAGDEIRE